MNPFIPESLAGRARRQWNKAKDHDRRSRPAGVKMYQYSGSLLQWSTTTVGAENR